LKLGLKSISRNLARIHCPTLHLHSRGDKTAPFAHLFYISRRVASPFVKARVFDLSAWKHSRHLLPLYHTTRDQVIEEINQCLAQCEAAAQDTPDTSAAR
jgi:pimeloyl-ACP methyl ester carboxylesterase